MTIQSIQDLLKYLTHSFRATNSVAAETLSRWLCRYNGVEGYWKGTTTVKAGYDDTLSYKNT